MSIHLGRAPGSSGFENEPGTRLRCDLPTEPQPEEEDTGDLSGSIETPRETRLPPEVTDSIVRMLEKASRTAEAWRRPGSSEIHNRQILSRRQRHPPDGHRHPARPLKIPADDVPAGCKAGLASPLSRESEHFTQSCEQRCALCSIQAREVSRRQRTGQRFRAGQVQQSPIGLAAFDGNQKAAMIRGHCRQCERSLLRALAATRRASPASPSCRRSLSRTPPRCRGASGQGLPPSADCGSEDKQ